ncbi:MAG: GNAT family N-acetyltransferase [Terriglobia bacterium]
MNRSKVKIRQATAKDVDLAVPLFDAYRQFYRQPPAPERARRFLLDRLTNKDSEILLAFFDSTPIGFTQLYPSFSSVRMARIFILNDLFVVPDARRSGAASALLHAAAEHARDLGAVRLALSTEVTNTAAQSLYEKSGWKRDSEFHHYQLFLDQ